MPPPRTSQTELTRKRMRTIAATAASSAVNQSTMAARANSHATPAIRPTAATLTPSSAAAVHGERRRWGRIGTERATKTKAGQEDAERRERRAGEAADEVADEGRRREDRPRRELPDRDGIEQLLVRQPAEVVDEIVAQEGEQDVAGAVEHRTDLQEGEEEPERAVRDGRARRHREEGGRLHAGQGDEGVDGQPRPPDAPRVLDQHDR